MTAAFNQMLAQGPTPIKFADPINQMAQLMQLKNYQQTGVVNQMAIDKGQRQQADQAAYRNMLAQPGFDVNDPATQARMLGLGGGDDLAALGTLAKNQIDMDTRRQALDDEAYKQEVEGYKAAAPYNGTREQIAQHFELGLNNPILKTRGVFAQPGAREGFMAKLASDEGFAELQRISNLASGGVSQQDTAELAKTKAMEKYYDARAAAAARPDAADAVKPPSGYRFLPDGNLIAISGGPADRPANAVKEDFETVNGIPYRRMTDGTLAAVIDQATGLPFVKGSTVPVLTPLQQRKEARLKLNDKAAIDRLKAGLRSMKIPIYGLDNPAETDAAGNVIKAAGKTPGLLSPGVKTSGIEGVSGLIPSIYGSNASRAESLLESVNNQMKSVGRDLLTSDDQGKLGNFAVKEWQIAADAVATINPRKDPNGWKVKLDEIVRRLETRIKLKEDEFEELYLDGEQSNAPSAEGKPASGGGKQVFEGITFERLDD